MDEPSEESELDYSDAAISPVQVFDAKVQKPDPRRTECQGWDELG